MGFKDTNPNPESTAYLSEIVGTKTQNPLLVQERVLCNDK